MGGRGQDVRGVDVTRAEGVDADALCSELARHAAAHLLHRGLRRVVRHPFLVLCGVLAGAAEAEGTLERCTNHVGDAATHARDEDDAPAVPEARHLAAGCLCGVQYAIDVHVHDLRAPPESAGQGAAGMEVMVTSWNVLASYSRQSLSGRKIPAAAMQTSMRPSLSPMLSPTFHIVSYVWGIIISVLYVFIVSSVPGRAHRR